MVFVQPQNDEDLQVLAQIKPIEPTTTTKNQTDMSEQTTIPAPSSCPAIRPWDLVREAKRQAGRNCVSYCLGLATCLLTVVTAATMQSLLAASPAVFLRQAEDGNGQIDVVLTGDGAALNFSAIRMNVEASGETNILNHMSPRSTLDTSCNIYTVPTDSATSTKRFYVGNTVFMAMDTSRDKAAGIGRSWTLPPLKLGETWVTQRLAKTLELVEGDMIDVHLLVFDLLARYITLNDDLNQFFTVRPGSDNTTAKCRNLVDPSGPNPRSDDSKLNGAATALCSPGSKTTLFCGAISDGTQCGMGPKLMVRLKVAAIVDTWHGRLPGSAGGGDGDGEGEGGDGGGGGGEPSKSSSMLAIEIAHVMETVMSAMPAEVVNLLEPIVSGRLGTSSTADRTASLSALSYDSVSQILVNLPTKDRNQVLLQDDYSSIQDGVVEYSGRVISSIGALWLKVNNPILGYLRSQRFTTLYLGMVMDILIAILLGLSSVLIYSLMMINVQGRQFELAVRRMLGATKLQVIALLGVQSMSFAVPSVIFGLPMAHFLTMYLFTGFNEIAGVTIEGGLSGTGVAYGIVLGLCIPFLGAVGPISSALGVELREALDITRSKTKVIEYKIESEQDRSRISPEILAVGGSLSVFGFLVYYLLPLALLSLDLRLFFLLFVALLLGMLVGLVLLASNLTGIVEYFVGSIFLCWARPVLRTLSLKNLIAHRKRNWKTSIMYSLSLAFIIFIAVASQMEFQTYQYGKLRDAGTNVVVLAGSQRINQYRYAPSMSVHAFRSLRKVLMSDDNVEDVAWVTSESADISIGNVGETNGVGYSRVQAVSPNYFQVGAPAFYRLESQWKTRTSRTSSLPLGEQLCTARGVQSIVLPTSYRNNLNYNEFNPGAYVAPVKLSVVDSTTIPFPTTTSTLLRPMAYLDTAPGLRFAAFYGSSSNRDAIVSPTTFIRLSKGRYTSIEQLPIRRILVKLKAEPTAASYKILSEAVIASSEGFDPAFVVTMWSLQDDISSILQTMAIIDFFFVSITLVGLLLCFFSLVASMVSNIHEQSQDIAIIRSMGLTRRSVTLVYVFEAFVLVVSSAILGMGVGYVVAWTFSSQRTLFTQLPLAFYFPWPIVVTVIASAIFCACLAAGIPSWKLVQLRITELLRKFA